MESAILLLTGARPLSKNNAINAILRLERKQKKFFKSSRIRILLFISYLFGIETINTLIHSRRPGGGGRRGTPLYGLYVDVPLDRVWFSSSLS